jgi:hypothetical protein
MRTKGVRWGRPHNEALRALFVGLEADPEHLENNYIDQFWDGADEGSVLRQVNKKRFRQHFRKEAAIWRQRESPQFSAFLCPFVYSHCFVAPHRIS